MTFEQNFEMFLSKIDNEKSYNTLNEIFQYGNRTMNENELKTLPFEHKLEKDEIFQVRW